MRARVPRDRKRAVREWTPRDLIDFFPLRGEGSAFNESRIEIDLNISAVYHRWMRERALSLS